MPMNETKLREYVYNYDINLDLSVVAVAGQEVLGLGMLGVRNDRTWITRLGVVPNGRQRGVGRSLMACLLDNARQIGASQVILEVIKNNDPAQRLFERFGFQQTRELFIIRRPPMPVKIITNGIHIEMVGYRDALDLLAMRTDTPSWLTDTVSLANAGNLSALFADLPSGGRGWLVYQNTVFQLTRLILQTDAGDPNEVANALLQNLHWRHPIQDTIVENVDESDWHLPAYQAFGYLGSYTRIEMVLTLEGYLGIE
jgi:ribosomal protein S18 acetylase RimI-like enzyme